MPPYNIQHLLPDVLAAVPEIRAAYEAECAATAYAVTHWTAQDIQDMETIRALHDLPVHDPREPGIMLVLNDLVVPFVVELAQTGAQPTRL